MLAGVPGVQRLVFGSLDYALDLDLGDTPGPAHPALDHAAAQLVLASRAAGIAAPVAGVTTAIGDAAQLLADLAHARLHGFAAKLCIHPLQVAAVHEAFTPSAAEVEWAVRVLHAASAAQASGALQLDGHMIDAPAVERARRIVERAVP